ncbi:MAG: hypothetical protein DRP35_03265, partial [Candidatus Zixiibacteriota bacterium]
FDGGQICIDSSFYPPAGAWAWATPDGERYAVWNGPFCYTIGTPVENTPPVLDPIGDQNVDENVNLNFTISASDADGDPLTYSMTSDLPAGYTFVGNVFDWTPTYDDAGVYTATFTVSDGTLTDEETITITVNNVNRTPVLNAIGNQITDENVQLTFTASGSDPDSDALAYTMTSDLPAGYTFVGNVFDWTPTFNDAGVYTATITVTDGLLTDEETITITVNDVNRAPVLSPVGNKVTNEEQLLQFNVIASDPDNDAVTISMVASTLPPAATFDGAQFSWMPVIGDAGVYSVKFVATDGNLEDAETIQITVNSANQPPYFEDPIPEFSVSEGETIVWLLHAFDPNSDNLTMWLDPVLPNMSFADLGNGILEITFSPNCNQAGGYELSAFVADGEFTVSVDVDFVVIEACDPNEIGIAMIEPDPIKYLFAQLIDQINAVIYFGNLSGGLTIADINLGSLMVNGLMPLAISVEPSHPMFDGEVLKVEMSMIDFVHSYPALYDTTVQTFSLTGLFNNKCDPIDVHGEFTFIGKLTGDVNLDGSVDISDLTYMVSYFFHNGRPPIDYGTADMDGDGSVGISDLTELINYIFYK